MNLSEHLEKTLEGVGVPVKYYEYAGTKEEYILYNEEAEHPTNHADNMPQDHVVWWQIHIFTPKEGAFRKHKETVLELLKAAGYYITDIRTLYEKETKTIHVVICCHKGKKEE